MGLRILEKFFKVRSLRLAHQLLVQFLFFLNVLRDDSIFHMNILIFIINHAVFPRDGCLLLFDMDSSDRITDEDFLNQLHKLDENDQITIMANMIIVEKCRLRETEPPDLEFEL